MIETRKSAAAAEVGICLVATSPQLSAIARQALSSSAAATIDVHAGRLADHVARIRSAPYSLVIVELQTPFQQDLAELEKLAHSRTGRWVTPFIVIADGLGEQETRTLLRLGVADWLSRGAVANELGDSVRRALGASHAVPGAQSTIYAFMPAVGGAGASTLSIAALEMLHRAKKVARPSCCVVDLELTHGVIADYLDTPARLDLNEIGTAPERLDAQLLEIMLSQTKDGYGVLAALPRLALNDRIDQQIIGRLLDLSASKFSHVVIDMPHEWTQWSDNIVRGSDKFFIVTDLSVTGLRHARRLAEQISSRLSIGLERSVIVNKVPWLGGNGVTKKNAQEVLGAFLAGYIPDGGKHVRIAQNHGQLLSEANSRSPVVASLSKLVLAS